MTLRKTVCLRAFDAKSVDVASKCEFSLGGAWQSSAVFKGLAANAAYKAKARVAAADDVAASDAVSVSFRMAPAAGQESGQQEQKAEAPAMIDLVMCDTEQVWLAAMNASDEDATDVCEFRIDGEWRVSPRFYDLEPDTEYKAQARVAAGGVAASDLVALTFRTSEAKYGAVTPKKVEVYDVTKNSAKVRTFVKEGNDTTSTCQFFFDGKWQDSSELKNLAAGTEYTVGARGVWGNGLQVSKTVEVTFETLESETHGVLRRCASSARAAWGPRCRFLMRKAPMSRTNASSAWITAHGTNLHSSVA